MNYSAILHAIDVELHKLLQVRNLLAGPLKLAPQKKSVSRKPAVKKSISREPVDEKISAPRLESVVTVLPPKLKREYRRTVKPHVPEPRALAAPRFDKVVVHMKPKASLQIVATPVSASQVSPETLEAVMRQKLLGGAA